MFGHSFERSREAFSKSTPGRRFPELWFEIPLLGDPWFDLHVLTSREDIGPEDRGDSHSCGGYDRIFAWFSGEESARQLAISWDLNAGDKPTSGIQLLQRRKDIKAACDLLEIAGRGSAAASYGTFTDNIPDEWFACYLGVFPGRPGHNLRVECIPDDDLQKLYAKDPASLTDHLQKAGVKDLNEIVPFCRELADTPFGFELQFDVKADGIPGDIMGASLRFGVGKTGKSYPPFEMAGPAGELMKRLEDRGLADERWRRLDELSFAHKLSREGESLTLYCAPVFVKVRFRKGEAFDAKAYLMAGALDK